jgi:hypothetical protein
VWLSKNDMRRISRSIATSIYQRNVDWFNFWLREKEDPDPAKADQYNAGANCASCKNQTTQRSVLPVNRSAINWPPSEKFDFDGEKVCFHPSAES